MNEFQNKDIILKISYSYLLEIENGASVKYESETNTVFIILLNLC